MVQLHGPRWVENIATITLVGAIPIFFAQTGVGGGMYVGEANSFVSRYTFSSNAGKVDAVTHVAVSVLRT